MLRPFTIVANYSYNSGQLSTVLKRITSQVYVEAISKLFKEIKPRIPQVRLAPTPRVAHFLLPTGMHQVILLEATVRSGIAGFDFSALIELLIDWFNFSIAILNCQK